MFKKITSIFLVLMLFAFSANSASDGELTLSNKNQPSEVKDTTSGLIESEFVLSS